jgi:II/X family phage/plasmid replication protein
VLLSDYLQGLQLPDNMPVPDDILQNLKPGLRSAYVLWKDGVDLRQVYSKAQFYRYRRDLLAYGIDVLIVQDSQRTNVVPMVRLLEARPAEIPQWAYDRGLVA